MPRCSGVTLIITGYVHCACGGCFEVLVGHLGQFCYECKSAGCPDRADPSDTRCQVEQEPPSEDFPGFTRPRGP